MYVKWKLISVCFEIVLVLVPDRCTVCTERTIGLEIILDARDVAQARKSFQAHPMVLLGDVGQVEAHFGLF
jgi:hypothetical protein